MTRILYTSFFTTIAASAAKADPGHLDAAGHGHTHWLAYGIVACVAAIAAGMWIARTSDKAKNA